MDTEEYDFERISKQVKKSIEDRKDYFCDIPKAENKFYALGMFPYPSGNAHIGHVRVYTIVDAKARYKKLKGQDVLNPLGWDAFGLPAENAAIQNRVAPDKWTQINIDKMRNEQFVDMGWCFDLTKEITTCDPNYYKWTQWIFLQFLKHGKAYRANGLVNWCPVDQTVLANEQVIEGKCWRDGVVVEKRQMEQWFLKITDYAERLWQDISKLKNWAPEAVAVQKNWINKSVGAKAVFSVKDFQWDLTVFTTRIDTVFGVTAIVIAPEHPLVTKFLQQNKNKELAQYVDSSIKKSSIDRMSEKSKTGVKLGLQAIHPLTGKAVDIWVGDYVLADYGTGAVMCVPAHDDRDFEFAKRYKLSIVEVIQDTAAKGDISKGAFTGDGILVNSGKFSKQSSAEARASITDELVLLKKGENMINFNLRDWSVGRQRYWGCPIPIVNCDKCGSVPVPEKDLPVLLPPNVSFQEGRADIQGLKAFAETTCPKCQGKARRETDTLDTFMCSSWYAFRFLDPNNSKQIFDSKIINKWMPIDFYVGGLEHAAQHMIYFRFFTKFFKDIGLVNFDEPVDHFFCNGMVTKGGDKMSKSKGNVVVPTDVISQFGADALRLYIMADTPSDLEMDWDDRGIAAKHNFIKKVYRSLGDFLSRKDLKVDDLGNLENFSSKKFLLDFYSGIHQLEQCLETNQYHNGVARIYEITRTLLTAIEENKNTKLENDLQVIRGLVGQYLIVTSVFLPFLSESLFSKYFKQAKGVYGENWPTGFEKYLVRDSVPVVVQVNGKKKGLFEFPKGSSEEKVKEVVLSDSQIKEILNGKTIRKIIYVQDRILNIVV